MKEKVFVCYRYNDTDAGKVLANIGVAYRMAFELIKENYIPFIPHGDCLIAMMFGRKLDLSFYYDYSIEWLKVCDAICVVEDLESLSNGCLKEIAIAKTLGLKFIYKYWSDF